MSRRGASRSLPRSRRCCPRPRTRCRGGDGWQFEPKWDGFRTLVFRDGDEILLQSRDEKPMNRYFPELVAPLRAALPERCVLDGEIVIAGPAVSTSRRCCCASIRPRRA